MFRVAFLILCMSPLSWAAGGLYINGVKVDGLTNVKLRGVDLDIDDKGDVRITAKGYNVSVSEAKTPPATAAKPAPATPAARNAAQPTRYYLVTSQNGDSQWDVDVYVNGTYVRRFQARDTPAPIEITRFMKNGDNSVRFHAVKQEGQPRSIHPGDFVQLSVDSDQLLANGRREVTHLHSYKRTAAETGIFDESVTISIR
jgi:hypothetical protein